MNANNATMNDEPDNENIPVEEIHNQLMQHRNPYMEPVYDTHEPRTELGVHTILENQDIHTHTHRIIEYNIHNEPAGAIEYVIENGEIKELDRGTHIELTPCETNRDEITNTITEHEHVLADELAHREGTAQRIAGEYARLASRHLYDTMREGFAFLETNGTVAAPYGNEHLEDVLDEIVYDIMQETGTEYEPAFEFTVNVFNACEHATRDAAGVSDRAEQAWRAKPVLRKPATITGTVSINVSVTNDGEQ